MNTEPPPGPNAVAQISRAIALRDWEQAFKLMDGLVGWAAAGRWLTIELELAGIVPLKHERAERAALGHGPNYYPR